MFVGNRLELNNSERRGGNDGIGIGETDVAKQQNAQTIAQKWSRNLTGAAESIRAGVDAVSESPGEAAIRAKQQMIANFNASMNDGTFEAGNRAYTLQQWKDALKTTGINRISDGTAKAMPKVQTFLTKWLPVMAQASADARAIPKVTEQDALERVRVVMQAGKNYKKANR